MVLLIKVDCPELAHDGTDAIFNDFEVKEVLVVRVKLVEFLHKEKHQS